jgi:hypothetical protein
VHTPPSCSAGLPLAGEVPGSKPGGFRKDYSARFACGVCARLRCLGR